MKAVKQDSTRNLVTDGRVAVYPTSEMKTSLNFIYSTKASILTSTFIKTTKLHGQDQKVDRINERHYTGVTAYSEHAINYH
ncbi:hypothetical protein FKM82_011564 [Ascaphus truei]